MAKNKYIAGVLNFFLLGPGYIYNGNRVITGIFLTLGAILGTFVELQLQTDAPSLFPISFVSFFLLALGTAYDAYKEAEAMN